MNLKHLSTTKLKKAIANKLEDTTFVTTILAQLTLDEQLELYNATSLRHLIYETLGMFINERVTLKMINKAVVNYAKSEEIWEATDKVNNLTSLKKVYKHLADVIEYNQSLLTETEISETPVNANPEPKIEQEAPSMQTTEMPISPHTNEPITMRGPQVSEILVELSKNPRLYMEKMTEPEHYDALARVVVWNMKSWWGVDPVTLDYKKIYEEIAAEMTLNDFPDLQVPDEQLDIACLILKTAVESGKFGEIMKACGKQIWLEKYLVEEDPVIAEFNQAVKEFYNILSA